MKLINGKRTQYVVLSCGCRVARWYRESDSKLMEARAGLSCSKPLCGYKP